MIQLFGLWSRARKYRFPMKAFLVRRHSSSKNHPKRSQLLANLHYSAVLRKNAVCTFESCQISYDKMCTFEENYQSFSLKFLHYLDKITNEFLQKIVRKMFINIPKNLGFIKGNSGMPKGSCGFSPWHGSVPPYVSGCRSVLVPLF